MEGDGADFGIGVFPDGLDESGMERGDGIYGDGDRAREGGMDFLEAVYVVS